MAEEILTRDLSTGRIHRRAMLEGVPTPQSFEADNLDQAGPYEVVTAEALVNAEPGELCERCFPPVGDE